MPKPGDNLSTLFRSLGPDSSRLQPAAGAAAPDAEQRWPLLKAMPPRRQEAPPPLGEEDRQRWNHAEAPAAAEPRRPALSMPSMSSKLAQSLARMGARKPAEAAPPAPVPVPIAAPEPRAERAAPAEARAIEFKPADEAPAPLMATLGRVAAEPEPEHEPAAMDSPAQAEPQAAERPAADSLSGLFRRLEAPEVRAAAPAPRRPSFFDRWAKR